MEKDFKPDLKVAFKYYKDGKKKALTMSYDDGHFYDRLLVNIFNQHRIKGTFHLNSGKLDLDPVLCISEIKELFNGHEISAHSLNHPHLTLVPQEVLMNEILEDRKRLEALTGYPVRGMSFPYGDYNEELLKSLPCLGIEYSRTTHSHGHFGIPSNFLTWHPICHHEQNVIAKLREFQNTNSWGLMSLFYVWGHSFEFERNNNWGLIEEFCKIAAADDSVWCATNIEIFDYVTAMRNLKFSVDRRKVFNPSFLPVWIDIEGEAARINGGEAICI